MRLLHSFQRTTNPPGRVINNLINLVKSRTQTQDRRRDHPDRTGHQRNQKRLHRHHGFFQRSDKYHLRRGQNFYSIRLRHTQCNCLRDQRLLNLPPSHNSLLYSPICAENTRQPQYLPSMLRNQINQHLQDTHRHPHQTHPVRHQGIQLLPQLSNSFIQGLFRLRPLCSKIIILHLELVRQGNTLLESLVGQPLLCPQHLRVIRQHTQHTNSPFPLHTHVSHASDHLLDLLVITPQSLHDTDKRLVRIPVQQRGKLLHLHTRQLRVRLRLLVHLRHHLRIHRTRHLRRLTKFI